STPTPKAPAPDPRWTLPPPPPPRLGTTTATIAEPLSDAFGQRQVSPMYKPLNQYHVVLEVGAAFLQHPDGLKHIYVRAASRALVPLSAFTHYAPANTPLT